MATESLWGNLEDLDTARTPAMILQEQAGLLGKLTNEVLEGKVGRDLIGDSNRMIVSLYVVAPALQRYRVKILGLDYNYDTVYPINVSNSIEGVRRQATNEDDLVSILREFLSSQRVKNVITTLIAESRMSSPN
jgi:hypothetical protein